MATATAQFEKQDLENALKELERTKQEFSAQLAVYEKLGNDLANNMGQYNRAHRRWVVRSN